MTWDFLGWCVIAHGILTFGGLMSLSARAQSIVDRLGVLNTHAQQAIAQLESAHDAANAAAEDADDTAIEQALATLEGSLGAGPGQPNSSGESQSGGTVTGEMTPPPVAATVTDPTADPSAAAADSNASTSSTDSSSSTSSSSSRSKSSS